MTLHISSCHVLKMNLEKLKKCTKKTNNSFLSTSSQVLSTNTKPFFLGKRDKPWKCLKTFSLYWSFLQICFEVCQKPQSNLLSDGILVQCFRMPNLVHEYKMIFLGKRGKA